MIDLHTNVLVAAAKCFLEWDEWVVQRASTLHSDIVAHRKFLSLEARLHLAQQLGVSSQDADRWILTFEDLAHTGADEQALRDRCAELLAAWDQSS